MSDDAHTPEIERGRDGRQGTGGQSVEGEPEVGDPLGNSARDGRLERLAWKSGVALVQGESPTAEIHGADLVRVVHPDDHEAPAREILGDRPEELDIRVVAGREEDHGPGRLGRAEGRVIDGVPVGEPQPRDLRRPEAATRDECIRDRVEVAEVRTTWSGHVGRVPGDDADRAPICAVRRADLRPIRVRPERDAPADRVRPGRRRQAEVRDGRGQRDRDRDQRSEAEHREDAAPGRPGMPRAADTGGARKPAHVTPSVGTQE